jgi:exopolysaccharide biosynthesis operon protein EpsL
VSSNKDRRHSETSRGRVAACAIAVAAVAPMHDAFALGSDTVFIHGTAGVKYDSNLFLIDSSVDPQTVIGNSHRDDTVYNVGLGLKADVPYSRQRFVADISVMDYKYSRFTDLDYVGFNGRANWLWQVGDYLTGDLGIDGSQSLQNYGYATINTQRNVVRSIRYFFDPRWRIAPNFELQGGLSYQTWTNTLAQADVNDFNQFGTRLGLAYVTPSGNHVGLQVEQWKAKFPNQGAFNNDYTDTRVSTFFDWTLTGASQITGSFGYKQRSHDVVEQRDFNGWTGSIGWNWAPTGRTRLGLNLARDIGGVDDLVVTYARTYAITATPTYQLTSKITLNGTARYQDLQFFGNTGFVNTTTLSGTLADRHDKIVTFGVGGNYQFSRVLSFALNYKWEHRNSNVALGDYNDNVISLTGQLSF